MATAVKHIMGWCNDNFHANHPTYPCKGEYTRFDIVAKRGKKEIIYGDKVVCDCPCHKRKAK